MSVGNVDGYSNDTRPGYFGPGPWHPTLNVGKFPVNNPSLIRCVGATAKQSLAVKMAVCNINPYDIYLRMTNIYRKKLRHFNDPGHAHELTFSCHRRLPLLNHDLFRRWLIGAIRRTCEKLYYDLLAYVIMPEHVHLIVLPRNREYNISNFLQGVKQSVSRRARNWMIKNDPEQYEELTITSSNGRKAFRFWLAGGGYDRNITNEETLKKMIQYVHNNPVRKELVVKPTDWEWSSAALYEEGNGDPQAIERSFG